MAQPTAAELETQRQLVERLSELGFVLPGSLVRRHTRCGKRSCRCAADPPELHGPYPQWTHSVAGTTVSRIWDDEQLRAYRSWIDNDRRARETLRDLEALAISIVERDEQGRHGPRARQPRGSPA